MNVRQQSRQRPVRTKVAYHHGDLKEQLLAATRQLVEEKGPDKFSVSEACRQAGVSTAAPYRHFTDRRDLLIAVTLQGMREMTASFHAALEGKQPGSIDAIASVGIAYVRFAEANPGLFRMMFADHGDAPEMAAAGHDCYGVVLGQVARYLGKTDIDDEVLQAGFPLWTFVHGASFLRIDCKADFANGMVSVEELVRSATKRLLPPR